MIAHAKGHPGADAKVQGFPSMDVMEAIQGRRSVRAYTDEPVEREVIQRLVDAAVWAPSAMN